MTDWLNPFNAGDTVRAMRYLHHGRIKAGDEGVFVRYGTHRNPFNQDAVTTCAVVDFPGMFSAHVSLRVLTLVRPSNAERNYQSGAMGVEAPTLTDTKARDLAHAHGKVAEAYKALAYALNDLKAVERR